MEIKTYIESFQQTYSGAAEKFRSATAGVRNSC